MNGLPIIATPPPTLVQEESTQKAWGWESRGYIPWSSADPWGSLVARHDSTLLIGQLLERGQTGEERTQAKQGSSAGSQFLSKLAC